MSREEVESTGMQESEFTESLIEAAMNDQPRPEVVTTALARFVASAPVAAPPRAGWKGQARLLKASTIVVAGSTIWLAIHAIGATAPASAPSARSVASADQPPVSVASPSVLTAPVAPLSTAELPRGLDVHALPTAPSLARTPSSSSPRAERPSASAPAAMPNAVEAPRESVFAEELARLREARAAIDRGSIDKARAVLADYEQAFPRGVLMPEARAMDVDALLAGGRAAEARRAAAQFVQRYPRSPQAARMQLLVNEGGAP